MNLFNRTAGILNVLQGVQAQNTRCRFAREVNIV